MKERKNPLLQFYAQQNKSTWHINNLAWLNSKNCIIRVNECRIKNSRDVEHDYLKMCDFKRCSGGGSAPCRSRKLFWHFEESIYCSYFKRLLSSTAQFLRYVYTKARTVFLKIFAISRATTFEKRDTGCFCILYWIEIISTLT